MYRKKCREVIEYNKEFIEENRVEIKSLEEDEKKVFKGILMII